MIEPTWRSDNGQVTLYLGDSLAILPTLTGIDAIVTDPPYPDYLANTYKQTDIKCLQDWGCRQVVFWSAKCDFPLDYTAIHIWDKKSGAGAQYERIFERNGHRNYNVYRYYLINSTVAASFTRDILAGHPSQKPIQLLRRLVTDFATLGSTVLDPFMGSGTTGVACVQTGRRFIGIEICEQYFDIAVKRISTALLQPQLLK